MVVLERFEFFRNFNRLCVRTCVCFCLFFIGLWYEYGRLFVRFCLWKADLFVWFNFFSFCFKNIKMLFCFGFVFVGLVLVGVVEFFCCLVFGFYILGVLIFKIFRVWRRGFSDMFFKIDRWFGFSRGE